MLYMSYDGMTDPLGQSQVIPYLGGLAAEGHHITLISFEKEERYKQHQEYISRLLSSLRIRWEPMSYTKSPPVLSTIWDILRAKSKARQLLRKDKYDVMHCRSYISALVGLWMKKNYGLPFIFDMRGFWADERVEGKLWNLRNPLYRMVFSYFKKKEKQFLLNAVHVISLTGNAKEKILGWDLAKEPVPITVIPCCADLSHFSRGKLNAEKFLHWKNKLGIADQDFIIGYLGAIGTWYMLEEMLDFFILLREARPSAKFLFVTQESPELIHRAARLKNISEGSIIITSSSRNDLPSLLELFHVSIFFIRPSFSKSASSPTKQGELMAMGIPVICNSGIGDTDDIIAKTGTGIVIGSFDKSSYITAIGKLDELLAIDKEFISNKAKDTFSLKTGIESYLGVYQKIKA